MKLSGLVIIIDLFIIPIFNYFFFFLNQAFYESQPILDVISNQNSSNYQRPSLYSAYLNSTNYILLIICLTSLLPAYLGSVHLKTLKLDSLSRLILICSAHPSSSSTISYFGYNHISPLVVRFFTSLILYGLHIILIFWSVRQNRFHRLIQTNIQHQSLDVEDETVGSESNRCVFLLPLCLILLDICTLF